jgi:hypothetical protein
MFESVEPRDDWDNPVDLDPPDGWMPTPEQRAASLLRSARRRGPGGFTAETLDELDELGLDLLDDAQRLEVVVMWERVSRWVAAHQVRAVAAGCRHRA